MDGDTEVVSEEASELQHACRVGLEWPKVGQGGAGLTRRHAPLTLRQGCTRERYVRRLRLLSPHLADNDSRAAPRFAVTSSILRRVSKREVP